MDIDVKIVKEIKDGLHNSEEGAEIIKWLTVVKSLLCNEQNKTQDILAKYGYNAEQMQSLSKVMPDSYRIQLYELLLTKFSVEWISKVGIEKFNLLVKPVFLQGNEKYSFITLFQALSETTKLDFRCQKCVALLEEFLYRSTLARLLQSQCSCTSSPPSGKSIALDPDQEIMIGFLTSLPSKMANRLRQENSDVFLPQSYIPLLALSILDTLDFAHQVLSRGENVSLQFASVLIGKLSLVGYASLFLDTILIHLCVRVRRDYMWCRICERIFLQVPARCQEAVVVPLLRRIPWYGLVDKFLGDSVIHNTSLKILLCTKLLLHKFFSEPKTLLHNIIGYLSSFHTRRHLLIEVSLALLGVWGDASSMRHISAEQHLYISRALMVCMGYINDKEKSANEGEFLKLLMPGVQAHLESSDPAVRMLGMVVAKTLTQTVAPAGPKLGFELDYNNHEVSDLLAYKELSPDPGVSEAEKLVLESEENCNSENLEGRLQSISMEDKNENLTPTADSDLDSDDDLEPYDMSNDRKVEKGKQPKFIRDCMEGLICSSDDPDTTEVCLSAAEGLIRKKTDGLEEIAVEFCKILLHLQDTHSFNNFEANRSRSLVALTVMCPSQVSEYLTSQFYERNYSIRQRMDILETLAAAAQELSDVEKDEQDERSKVAKAPPSSSVVDSEASSWREVIQRRIESNTRRFAHGRTRPEPVPTLNRFAPVAGKFFYPLMHRVDNSDPCLDLIGKDSLLLFRLLYTLAVVLHSSKNLHVCAHMGRALLEFTWPLRLHRDSSVRQAVLVATTTVFLVVPPHVLMSDMSSDVTETKAWLGDVMEQDPDTECQKLSAQAVMLLQGQIEKEIQSSASAS